MTIVRAALLQTDWSGDQASMIDKHEEAAREAAADGAQIMCFQELFYGPYSTVFLPHVGDDGIRRLPSASTRRGEGKGGGGLRRRRRRQRVEWRWRRDRSRAPP